MAINHEIEFKQILTQQLYSQIKQHFFSNAHLFKQVNYYIDTPDFKLKSHRSALRIRVKDQCYEMTLKVPASTGLTEYNHKVTIEPELDKEIKLNELPTDIYQIITETFGINNDSLIILGALTTYRMEVAYDGDLLVLDKSEYLGMTDYELEFEVSDYDTGLVKFQKLLHQFDIQHQPPLNKVQRFFMQKEKLSNNIL
ncbi:CYTH domain-containing protein [Staphylococcus simiae]|uniref:CYTH domain-containing protein n=1 Tax=Staphylococcus simiae TaxID=308354 RepID=UPI001A963BD3|nr:CYTH domain-containing protein [Staphylococcus simiae]MBO1199354.1 CYTH domain-containing protein [Staphylococcus simiae]MBO1201655.1 CYTH domain-containing protein [Staphylococcus simiae]MBO1203775.1 CYTH domain-containing protein [Staphylococcus simiae]MBO1211677.1 CYTH domain-containing protein [Staphylococcus simiae]MBO1230036.1 CYTH domain-containing protein [Staphylococcus simiae]